jgi:pimeloyl-ACP methyl ester carboxylesterase
MFAPTFRADPGQRPFVAEWLRRLGRCDRGAIRRAVLGVANRAAVSHEIAAITAPTLVIVGADDVPTPVERAREIAAAISGARLEIVPDCGHSSAVEQPAAVTALLQEFLAAAEAAD